MPALPRCSTSANASLFLFAPTTGSAVEYSAVVVIGSIDRTDTSGQAVVIDFGVSGAFEFGQAGSGRGVGDKDGEPHGAIMGGERAIGTDRVEDFFIFEDTCGGGEIDLRGDGGDGLLVGRT
jgi:hypothetical protein